MPDRDAMNLLTKLTRNQITAVYGVWLLEQDNKSPTRHRITEKFSNASEDAVASLLFAAKDAGALSSDEGGDRWHTTDAGAAVLPLYFRDFAERHPEAVAA